ncbi:hypothetical protein ONZ45_g6836 [Pleurotus djamor]|nr:hypothetical protein ONZ45_g6836 [Pleurotus djamor]
MVCWWSILVWLLIPLANAVQLSGIPSNVDVGQTIHAILTKQRSDNSNPFELAIEHPYTVLGYIQQLKSSVTVNVTIQLPPGLYTIAATEPGRYQPFSNRAQFLVRDSPTPSPSAATTTPALAAATEPSSPNDHPPTTTIVIAILCGVFVPTVCVLSLLLYRRQKRTRTRRAFDIRSDPFDERPPSPPIPYTIGYPGPIYPQAAFIPDSPPMADARRLSSHSVASIMKTGQHEPPPLASVGYQRREKDARVNDNIPTIRNWSEPPPPEYGHPV